MVLALLCALHLAALFAALTLPLAGALLCAVGIAISLVAHLQRELRKRGLSVLIDTNGAIEVSKQGMDAVPVSRAHHVGAWLVTLHLERWDHRLERDLLITVDSADAGSLRALRRAVRFRASSRADHETRRSERDALTLDR